MAPRRPLVPLAQNYRRAVQALRTATVAYAVQRWREMTSWSDEAAADMLNDVVPVVMAARERSASITAAYMGLATGTLPQTDPMEIARRVRFGADPYDVYFKSVADARAAYASKVAGDMADLIMGDVVTTAINVGERRLSGAIETDITRAGDLTAQDVLRQASISTYRTVTRPGACELCIVASTRVYNTDELRPLHTNCHCIVVPGEKIPGALRDTQTLQTAREYADGDVGGRRLVTEFNDELGPTLNWSDAAATVARRKGVQGARKTSRTTAQAAADPRTPAQRIADKRAAIAANQAAIDRGADTAHMRGLVEQMRADLAALEAAL